MYTRLPIRGKDGQTLVLFALVLPMLFGMVAFVVDGGNLLVQRRHLQNAADAAALAAAQALGGAVTSDPSCGLLDSVQKAAECYSDKNGGPASLHVCAEKVDPVSGLTITDRGDSNCYATPYKDRAGEHADQVYVRLTRSPPNIFAGALGIKNPFDVSARAIASTAPLTSVTPGSSTTVISSDSTTVITGPGTPVTNVTTITVPSNGAFMYAAGKPGSDPCKSISITHGGDDFSAGGIWSNGGITASGSQDTASLVRIGDSSCPFPGQLTPPGPSSIAQRQAGGSVTTLVTNLDATHITVAGVSGFATGQSVWIDADPNQESRTISAVNTTTKTLTLSSGLSSAHAPGVVVTNTDWPLGLPNFPSASSCTSGGATIDAAWLAAHPAGAYCFTGVTALKASFTGYEFVSLDTSSNAIKCNDNGLSFTGPSGSPSILFYAPYGGITLTPGNGVTITGDVLAPSGSISFTGGGNKLETGYFESLTATINNGPTHFQGSGPDGGTTTTTTTTVTTTPGSTTTVTTPGTTYTTTTPGSIVTTGTDIELNE